MRLSQLVYNRLNHVYTNALVSKRLDCPHSPSLADASTSVVLIIPADSQQPRPSDLWMPEAGVLSDPAALIAPDVSNSIVASGAPGAAVERGGGYNEHKVSMQCLAVH